MIPPYVEFTRYILDNGVPRPSRYGGTLEVLVGMVTCKSGSYPLRPGLNPAIGFMEGLFLVGGFFDFEAIKAVAPKADHSLFTEGGAYGPRVAQQLPILVEMLRSSEDSRQHMLYLTQPGDQYRPDTPCTTSLQFLKRYGRLDLIASMRSSDVLKGLPTDILQFGVLLQVLANCFGWQAGIVHVVAGSSHIYQDDAGKLPYEEKHGLYEVPAPGMGSPAERFKQYQGWARLAAADTPWSHFKPRGMT